MTPLIREMSAMVPEPETAHWFDLGTMPKHVPAGRIEWEQVRHMPYPRCVSVFRTELGDRYAVLTQTGDRSITVTYLAIDHRQKPLYSRPIAIMEVDGELRYMVGDKAPTEPKAVSEVARVLVVVTQRIHERGNSQTLLRVDYLLYETITHEEQLWDELSEVKS